MRLGVVTVYHSAGWRELLALFCRKGKHFVTGSLQCGVAQVFLGGRDKDQIQGFWTESYPQSLFVCFGTEFCSVA